MRVRFGDLPGRQRFNKLLLYSNDRANTNISCRKFIGNLDSSNFVVEAFRIGIDSVDCGRGAFRLPFPILLFSALLLPTPKFVC